MSNLAYKLEDSFTYADYLSWDDGMRYEIIDGAAYVMDSPSARHQRISRELAGVIWLFLKDKPNNICEVFPAPFDVRLFPDENYLDDTVMQPDILVVCDKSKLADGRACKGAPDLIIEILSQSSVLMDRKVKAEKYLKAGVREYWIVNPESLDILVNSLADGRYVPTLYKDTVMSSVPPGLTVDLDAVRANATTS